MTRATKFSYLVLLSCALVTTTPGQLWADPSTALDDFINAPDPTFAWTDANTITGPGYTADVLNMTSQEWLTTADVDRTDWQNYVTIIKPTNVTSHRALLWIDGGSNGGSVPGAVDPGLLALAQSTGSVVIDLGQVPNEPLTFTGQAPRSEDAIIAYTWEQYLNTGNEQWPAQLPMTLSAVRAMDAVQAFDPLPPAVRGTLATSSFPAGQSAVGRPGSRRPSTLACPPSFPSWPIL